MSSSESDDDFDVRELSAVGGVELATVEDMKNQGIKQHIYNKVAIEERIKQFSMPKDWPWIERLEVIAPALDLDDAQDDLERESQFYQRALHGVKGALQNLAQAGIPFKRPRDFYAEMLKPDVQMARIKDSLLREQKAMHVVAERKKHKELQKYSKAVHSAKQQERAKAKKANIADARKWALKNESNSSEVKVGRTNKRGGRPGQGEKSLKRQKADKKYGHGGKKRFAKSNDKESARDSSGFNLKKNRKGFGDVGRKKRAGGKPNRPGKARRNAARS